MASHFKDLEARQCQILRRISLLAQARVCDASIAGTGDEIANSSLNSEEKDKDSGDFSGSIEKRLSILLRNGGVAKFEFKRVPPDYYERSFDERRDLLAAHSIHHLCKSIVMVNTQADENVKDCSNPNNSKYYVVVIQYTARLNAEKVKAFIHSLNKGKIPKKRFNMRLAPEDESCALTGFEHNAVTPIGMKTDIPVILSESIAELTPAYFWLGGGEMDLKLEKVALATGIKDQIHKEDSRAKKALCV